VRERGEEMEGIVRVLGFKQEASGDLVDDHER
jgi:hypothetical protein